MTGVVQGAPEHERTFFGQPRLLANLFGVEMWERFSYYALGGILLLYLYYPVAQGGLELPKATAVSIAGAYGGLVYLSVLAASVVGLGIVMAGAWRTGLSWIGVGLLVAAATRLVLSDRRAGMLRVRRKWSDVLMLTVAGVGLIVLTIVVPNQPPA